MRTIVITGTDRGLGHALAALSLEAGDSVIATHREVKAAALRSLAERFPERLSLVPLELGDAASIAAAARRIRELTSRVDVLLHNAGILGDIEFSVGDPEFDPDAVLETIRINTIGPLRVTHELWPLLVAGGGKLLVNISSEAGSNGHSS